MEFKTERLILRPWEISRIDMFQKSNVQNKYSVVK